MSNITLITDPSGNFGTEELFTFQEKGFFYRSFHLSKKNRLKKELYQAILTRIQGQHNLNELDVTERVLNYTLKLKNIDWKKGKKLSEDTLEGIRAAIENVLFYSGEGFVNEEEESEDVDNPMIPVVDFFVLKRKKINYFPLLKWKFFKTLLVKMDPSVMQQFKEAIQLSLNEGFNKFNANAMDEEVFRLFVFHMVSFFAYAYPQEKDTFDIPVKIGDDWVQVTYTVDKKFALTPSWFSSPIPAFGLMPQEEEDAPPIISFLGTTLPAGEGFIASLLSDFTPFFSVGHLASLYAEEEFAQWFEDKDNVIITGKSLGGSLALHAARLHSESISEVYPFNPAGCYPWNSFDENVDANITIVYQWNDLISTMGVFPDQDNVTVYRVLSEKEESCCNAHRRIYTAGESVTLVETKSEFENARPVRYVLMGAHLLGSPLIFSFALPVHLLIGLIRPVYNLLSLHYLEKKEKHWSDVAVIVSVVGVGIILIGLGISALTVPQALFPSYLTQFVLLIGSKEFIIFVSSIIAIGAILAACGLRGAFREPLNAEEVVEF